MQVEAVALDGQRPRPRRRGRPAAEAEKILPLWECGDVGYLGLRIVLAARLFERRVSAILAEISTLTLPDWRVLSQLGVMPGATVRVLADGAAVDRAEVSRSTRRLTDVGLVRRIENKADLRSPMFELTAAGQAEVKRVREPILEHIHDMVQGLSQRDLDAADRVLWAAVSRSLGYSGEAPSRRAPPLG